MSTPGRLLGAIRKLFKGFRPKGRTEGEGSGREGGPIEWVIAGLGNPGGKYVHSRHNSGFRAVDHLAQATGVEPTSRRFGGLTARTEVAGASVMLVKPQMYYNVSGECVAGLLGYFKIPVSRLIVIHDELDLEEGRVQIKLGGGDAGNRGVRSIIDALGSRDFIRVRIGVAHPARTLDDKEYLLRPMTSAELAAARQAQDRAAEATRAIVEEGLERAMGQYNRRS